MKFKEQNAIEIKQYKSFVYFLISENEVVYVGQTKDGLHRPLSHKDKDFDEIQIILFDEEKLDEAEDRFIKKYEPKYNRRKNCAMNFSLESVKREIRRVFNIPDFSLRDLRKILKKLSIEPIQDQFSKQENITCRERQLVLREFEENGNI